MHYIVLYISIYLFILLHILCDLRPIIIMPENMRFWPHSYLCFLGGHEFLMGGLPKYV